MRQSIAILYASLFLVIPSFSQSKAPEGTHTAEITKIDAKNKSLQVKEVIQPTSSPRDQNDRRGTTGGNGGGGNRRRGGTGTGTGRFPGGGGGVGFPGGGSGGGSGRRPGGSGGGSKTTQPKEYKVFVT